MKRKVCVVTGSRAEYGLLRLLIREVEKDLDLQLLVTGMHLSKEFGFTYREVEKDGFRINKKINILSRSDKAVDVAKSTGKAIENFAKAYKELKPEIVVVLGDRFEIFGAAAAAHISRIPIAHIHGGELTEGAFDDAFRHSITKMSQLHFVSTEEYRRRVIQLGEDPKRVFNVGAIGLDNIKKLKLFPKKELENNLNFRFNKHNFLVTFHPVTLENNTSKKQFQNLLNAFKELKDTNIIFTKTNADTGGRIINVMIDSYTKRNKGRAISFASLGRLRYLSTMQYVDAVVGNSSSGIIEAPSFKIGTINIGDRQKGRIKADSVIDCKPDKESILMALKILYSKKFQKKLKDVKNPYEKEGDASKKIKEVIKKSDLSGILKKEFYDLEVEKRD